MVSGEIVDNLTFLEKHGFSFVKCVGKEPVEQGWNKKKLKSAEILSHLENVNNATYGVVPPKGYFIIDVDNKGRGLERYREVDDLLTVSREETFYEITANGGYHIYYKGDIPSTFRYTGVADIEIKKPGSHKVIGAGSVIDGKKYVGKNHASGINTFPQEDLFLLQKHHTITKNLEWCIKLLKIISVKQFRNRHNDWISVLFAVYDMAGGTEEGKKAFINWSVKDTFYSRPDIENRVEEAWRTVKETEGGITFAHLLFLIKDSPYKIVVGAVVKGVHQTIEKFCDYFYKRVCQDQLSSYIDGENVIYDFKKKVFRELPNTELNNMLYQARRSFDPNSKMLTMDDESFFRKVKATLLNMSYVSDKFYLKKETNGVNCNNGVLFFNGATPSLEEHNPKYFFRKKIESTYLYNPDCPVFEKFIKRILPPNREAICGESALKKEADHILDYLYELIGYILQSDKPIPIFVFLYGTGSNGKSVFIKVLQTLVGEDSYLSDTITNFTGEGHYTSFLVNKLLFVDEDMKPNCKIDPSIIKKLSENTNITCNPKHKQPFTFRSTVTPVMSSNTIPSFGGDMSHGLSRRSHIVNFKTLIATEDQDIYLINKIEREKNAIFSKAMMGLHRLKKRMRFDVPKTFEVDKKAFFGLANNTQDFLQSVYSEDPSSFETVDSVYEQYIEYCSKEHIIERFRLSRTKLVNTLCQKNFIKRQTNKDDNPCLSGIKIKEAQIGNSYGSEWG